jgi:hypothetical protein
MVPVQGPVQVADYLMRAGIPSGPGKLPLPPELVRRVVEHASHAGDY